LGGPSEPPADVCPRRGDASLQPLLEWIAHHLANDLTLDDLAAVANLSRRTLLRRFRA
jgi:transcriptional regulator GlxA family with amidase domain